MRRYRIGRRLIRQFITIGRDTEVGTFHTTRLRNIGNGKMVIIVCRQGNSVDIVRRHSFPLYILMISERFVTVIKMHIEILHSTRKCLCMGRQFYSISDGEIVAIGHVVVDATAR